MQKELTNSKYKEQFAKEKPKEPVTEMDVIVQRKTEMDTMKSEMPYMKMRKEFNDLQMALWEQDMMLGKAIVDDNGRVLVPGIFGFELYLRQQNILQEFHGYRSKLKQQIDEGERVQQLINRFSTLEGSVQLTSTDAGDIHQFITGEQSAVHMTEDTLSMQIPEGEGYYEIKMTISDWLCKDAEGKFFVVSDQEYQYLSKRSGK